MTLIFGIAAMAAGARVSWVLRRKAAVRQAVRLQLLRLDEVSVQDGSVWNVAI